MQIAELEFSVRTTNLLKSNGINTIDQLVALSYIELKRLNHIGVKSLDEICWKCIQLLNGKLLERAIEWEEHYRPKPTEAEMKAKAQAYWNANEAVIMGKIKKSVQEAFSKSLT